VLTAAFERSVSVSAVAAVMLQHVLCILQEANSSPTDHGIAIDCFRISTLHQLALLPHAG
jgi:hypothetical protein